MFEATRKELTTLELLFNGEWIFYSDSDHRCILIELKNINKKSIYDKHNSQKNIHSSNHRIDSLNNSFRTKKPGESVITNRKD